MEDGAYQVEIEGLEIAYRRAGAGPPLVLLHGATLDGREWLRALRDLSNEFTVVAWDAPGSGRSSDPPETFRLPDFADCLAAFINELGLERPNVLGVSFGAALALELYHRHPTIPQTLILVGAYAGWAGSLPPEMVEGRLRMAERNAERPPTAWASEMVATYLSASAPPELVAEVVTIVSECRPVWTRTAAHALAEADLRDVLPHIHVPTLLLYGAKDVRSPANVAEALSAQIPGARLVVVPGVGHVIDMEAPERFTAEVRAFLRQSGR